MEENQRGNQPAVFFPFFLSFYNSKYSFGFSFLHFSSSYFSISQFMIFIQLNENLINLSNNIEILQNEQLH